MPLAHRALILLLGTLSPLANGTPASKSPVSAWIIGYKPPVFTWTLGLHEAFSKAFQRSAGSRCSRCSSDQSTRFVLVKHLNEFSGHIIRTNGHCPFIWAVVHRLFFLEDWVANASLTWYYFPFNFGFWNPELTFFNAWAYTSPVIPDPMMRTWRFSDILVVVIMAVVLISFDWYDQKKVSSTEVPEYHFVYRG